MCSENKKFWVEFIEVYRGMPCLWDVRSKQYSNTHLRQECFTTLVEKLKEIDPFANIDLVKKKVDNLRSSYRRELRKVEKSKSSGCGSDDVYEPTLWYFHLLNFIKDQETARKGVSSLQRASEINDTEPALDSREYDDISIHDEGNCNGSRSSSLAGTSRTTTPAPTPSPAGTSRTTTPAPTPSPAGTSRTTTPAPTPSPAGTSRTTTPAPTPSPTPVLKRSRKSQLNELEKKKEKFLDAAAVSLTNAGNEDYVFGQSLGLQLAKVDEQQKIIAEKLISDVLYFAKLKQLTHGTKILLDQQETYTSIGGGRGHFTNQFQENSGPTPPPYGMQSQTYLVNSTVGNVVTQPSNNLFRYEDGEENNYMPYNTPNNR